MGEDKINFCDVWVEEMACRQGIKNKLRYMLEEFFEKEWASKTNEKVMKEGYHQEFTYTKESIAHFIEDAIRVFEREWRLEWNKVRVMQKRIRSTVKETKEVKNGKE